jgi:hypothetical protein
VRIWWLSWDTVAQWRFEGSVGNWWLCGYIGAQRGYGGSVGIYVVAQRGYDGSVGIWWLKGDMVDHWGVHGGVEMSLSKVLKMCLCPYYF